MRHAWRAWARWLPFAAGAILLLGAGLAGTLRLDLAFLLGAGLTGAAWLAARELWPTALLVLALLAPQGLHFAVQAPGVLSLLSAPRDYVRVEGTVRSRAALATTQGDREPAVLLLLGSARVWHGERSQSLAEIEVELPARSEWAFAYRSRLRIGGRLRAGDGGARWAGTRLRLRFAEAEHYRRAAPVHPGGTEALRLHLRDRAAYYLSRSALAVYLPIVLGLRERDTPEAREVAQAFRRVGVAHLFAISGLHVGLLYLLFSGAQHWGLGWLLRGQGWVQAPAVRRAGVLAAMWLYIALIGFPLPAVRAALMASLLVWGAQWGTRTPPLYLLSLAALALLAFDPTQVYDISFQLSFGAYLFLLCALALQRPALGRRVDAGWPRWAAALVEGMRFNLWMTLLITLGLWPVVSATFGQLSLLVFVGNLVMIPILGFVVLPLGLAGLAVTLMAAGGPPGGAPERLVFAMLDAVLRAWVWLVERLDALGAPLVFPLRVDWSTRAFFLYYVALLGGIGWALTRRNRAGMAVHKASP